MEERIVGVAETKWVRGGEGSRSWGVGTWLWIIPRSRELGRQ